VLLLGPLYHLADRDDRVQALREARRIVRTDGAVYAAAISRWPRAWTGCSSSTCTSNIRS
jgi:hypothetical protein